MSCRMLRLVPLLLLMAACASPGPVDNPIGRTLTWFSYLGGEDIRATCRPGAPDRYRFVYNGIYTEQLRAYDLEQDAVGPGAILQSRVHPPSLASLDLRDPLAAWNGRFDQRLIGAGDLERLERALVESGFDAPARDGDFLRSDAYYWAVSACRRGRFHFNAWQQPGDDLDRLSFVRPLLALDRTGVAYNEPRRLHLGPFRASEPEPEDVRFQVQIGENGLRLGPTFR